MSVSTNIEWTDATWNPWHGCHKVSQGCKFCYMFRDKARYGQDPNVVTRSKTKFTDPLKWPRLPTLCFTCSWSDWLIEEADPWREEAYEIIRATPWITYQILTKRIDRAAGRVPDPALPNVWLGVSVENQATADERIPLLLKTPAAKRFVSYEPALGHVDFTAISHQIGGGSFETSSGLEGNDGFGQSASRAKLDWLIVGGESGPGARPFDIQWARNTIEQCKDAGVACFVKQLGARPMVTMGDGAPFYLDMKGKAGDMSEWPEDLRVRQFPEVSR